MENPLAELRGNDVVPKLRALLAVLEKDDAAARAIALKNAAGRIISAMLDNRNHNTAANYRTGLVMFSEWIGAESIEAGVIELLRRSQGDVNELALGYRKWLIGRDSAPAVINHRLVALRMCLKHARVFGLTTNSIEIGGVTAEGVKDMSGPAPRDTIKILKELGHRRRGMPEHRYHARMRDRAIAGLFFFGGLRCHEALFIDWPDHVDLQRSTVKICGKGKRHLRDWFIPDQAKKLLCEWLEIRGKKPGPLFGTVRPTRGHETLGRRIERHSLFTRFQGYGLKRLHAVRHSGATACAELKMPLAQIQYFLRHSSPATTARYYLDNKKAQAEEAAQTLAQKFAVSRPRKEGGA